MESNDESDEQSERTVSNLVRTPRPDWLEHVIGSMDDFPEFEQVVEYGRTFRTVGRSVAEDLPPVMNVVEPQVTSSSVETAGQIRLHDRVLRSRYFLSPLAGYTNLAYRRTVRELGGLGLATTDLVNARALLKASPRTMELIAVADDDRPVAIQIYGSNADEMAAAAQWLETYGADVIDINMGCPVHKVVKGGGGSAMMCDVVNTVKLVERVVASVKIPVTVKMRLGWDDQNLSAPKFAREFEKVGVAAVIIHGRTREQGFSGHVNIDGIRQVVEAVEKIPVIGNGDVRTIADAERMLRETGCAGISIGRGALLNPWIFQQLARWEATGDPGPGGDYDMRLDFMSRHYHYCVEERGERFASLNFRKFAAWYCKALKPGKEIQRRLVMLENVEEFHDLVNQIRENGPPPHWHANHAPEIAVPKGPISHW